MSDLWQQLELSTELETDIPDTVSGSVLLISVIGKFKLFHIIV